MVNENVQQRQNPPFSGLKKCSLSKLQQQDTVYLREHFVTFVLKCCVCLSLFNPLGLVFYGQQSEDWLT